ncbi:MAG TPA: hypothetical protein VFU06_11775 [Longimicrobiales bacterium]|nr:hypothetical protein [Longimicrobiales bacterium]
MQSTERILLRDLAIFQLKLFLDGLKDVVLAPVSIVAAGIDLVLPGKRQGHRFYAVMRMGERFDRWLSLFSAANRAEGGDDGLFGPERADPDSMLGRIESMLFDQMERGRGTQRAA